MTSPGYSDFQRTQFSAGQILLKYNAIPANGQLLFAGPTHQWSFLNMRMLGGGSSTYTVRLTWYFDTTFSNGWQPPYYTIGPATNLSICVPVQAAGLQIDVLRTAGPFTDPIVLYVFGTTKRTLGYELNAGYNRALLADNTAYAINQTKTLTFNYDYYGMAQFQCIPAQSATGVNVALQYWDFFVPGATVYMQWWGATRNAPVDQQVPMMATPSSLIVANLGTAQTIQALLTPVPS